MATTPDREGRSRPGSDRARGTAVRIVVFTDLDGTLLRHEDYDWSAAREILATLAQRRIPVIIASSKTRAEIEAWRARLGNHDPFISENGGALYIPVEAAVGPVEGATPVPGYRRVEFGAPYPRLRDGLARLSGHLGIRLRGFGDMEAGEIARWTGLSAEDAGLARQREYDEPFVCERALTQEEESRLKEGAAALGLHVTRGGRFHHLIGPSGKGAAARLLISAYAAGGGPVLSLGLGDSANDLELLQAVDRSVVVARADGTHSAELRAALPHALFAKGIGPEGFREGVLAWLPRAGGPGADAGGH